MGWKLAPSVKARQMDALRIVIHLLRDPDDKTQHFLDIQGICVTISEEWKEMQQLLIKVWKIIL